MTSTKTSFGPKRSSFLIASDHKEIGRFFIAGGILFGLLGFVGLLISSHEATDLDTFWLVDSFDQAAQTLRLSIDGLVLASVLPLLIGIGLYVVPLQVGAAGVAFGRGLAASFWCWVLGVFLLVASYVADGGAYGSSRDFVSLWLLSLVMILAALVWALVVLASTILGARTTGMTMVRVPATTWSYLVFCVVGVLLLPRSIAEAVFEYFSYSAAEKDLAFTDQLAQVTQNMLQPPTVFLMGIPLLGISIDALQAHGGVQIGSLQRKAQMAAISVFGVGAVVAGFGVLESHDTADTTDYAYIDFGLMFVAVSVILVTSTKAAIVAMRRPNATVVGALLSGCLLVGAVTAALLGSVSRYTDAIDLSGLTAAKSSESYPAVVAYLEGLLLQGSVFALVAGAAICAAIAGLAHWSSKVWGRQLTGSLSFISVLCVGVGSIIWAVASAMVSMRTDNGHEVSSVVGVATLGLGLSVAGLLITLLNLASLSSAKVTGSANPSWSGLTLEWVAGSPPVKRNFDAQPNVQSPYPLSLDVFESNGDEVTGLESKVL